MDDALSSVAIDLSGRGYCVLDLDFEGNDLFGLATDLIRHFLETLSAEGKFNLHGCVAYGSNDHHKAESLFKALGRALDKAVRIDPKTTVRYQAPKSNYKLGQAGAGKPLVGFKVTS
jgi:imidazoleglycerol-phosphate dehydratase